MNCAEVIEWMHRYLDHDLSRDESLEMFRHIDNCPSCAELFERLNALSRELEQLPDVSPPFSLVDSIQPKLEAIDREADVMAALPAEEQQVQPMSRKASRAKNRNSSLASRFGIGAAAAAVVLGIALFNMPEKLPGAQVDDIMNSSAEQKRSNDSAADIGGANAGTGSTFGAEAGASSGGEANSTPVDTGMSTMDAPGSSSPTDGGQSAQGGGSAPDTAAPTERTPDGRASAPAKSVSPNKNRSGISKKMASPEPSAKTPASQEAGPTDKADSPSDPAMSLQAPAYKGGDMGIMRIAPMETPPGSPSWTSPNGLYTAVIDGQKLVIYRAAGDGSEGRQAVDTIPFEGTWVSGEWTADSRQFSYITAVEGKEQHSAYTVHQETPDPSATPSVSAAPASPSPSPSSSPGASTK
ncbi:anti-sigma factor family protein [Paenibacillus rhizophilus]|uniref:Anti-sigma-W factor RsiW n=1 Tax=Paenibacillus rhizophilus TaxID=1850366 RepID=A0A3N9P659_9BACL|nr:zf-HC2 domain-containing protein [Paenibacillus rhizophilus]RQW11713.1 hypothetical protein EH198_11945 [Paenibacillus rhizophilus]